MDYGITGRRALVAGSSSGIGKACAELLAREGAKVFLVARDASRLESAAHELRATSADVGFLAADLSIASDVDRVIDAASRELGGVDILINNAGGPKSGLFSQLGDDDWQRSVDLNLMSAVRLTRGVLEGMIERRWGRIVNISSTSIRQPIEGLMLSNSIRMAVAGFAKTLSNEVGQHGVTVNTVAPGYTNTDRLTELAEVTADRQGISVDALFARWREEIPARRIGRPDEIASAVLFLASESASYVNGIVLTVDGGRMRASL